MGRSVVGLDIGHTSVRAVGISAGAVPTVTSVGTAPLMPGAVNEGEVLDPDSVAAALRQAWRKSGLGRDVVLGVSGRHVIVRQVSVPWLAEPAFRQALPYRVANQLPVPVDDVILDYLPLRRAVPPPAGEGPPAALDAGPDSDAAPGEPRDGDGRTVDLLLVAAMRQPVLRSVEAAQRAGLRPVRIDLSGLALLRLGDDGALPPGVAEARVDVGAEVTTVVVRVDGQPRFVRMLAGEGGAKVTRALVDRVGLTAADAEDLKCRIGTSSGPATATEHRAARVVIDRVTDGTLAAVRSSLDYFLGSAPDVDGLGRVVLSGGGAHLPGLADRLAVALDIPVVLADPLAGLAVSRKVDQTTLSPALALAAGLGLAEVA